MKIDIYTHIVPKKYRDKLYECTSNKNVFRIIDKLLVNLDDRFRIMDRFGDLAHVLTPAGPALEEVVDAKASVELAQIHNDELAGLVQKYPDRFPAAVAVLPLGDIEASLKELDRAIKELRLRGVLIHTPICCLNKDKAEPFSLRQIDSPEFMPIFEKMAQYNLPIWIHPLTVFHEPYGERSERFEYRIWQVFGWPFESTVAMTRLVFSGVLEKYPNLKFIIHHSGAMVPFLEQRIAMMYSFGEMSEGERYTDGLTKKPLEYFRMFYADTAIGGSTPGLICAHNFFGAKHMLFGTDAPYDSQIGYVATRKTIESIERMEIPMEEKQAIFEYNASELLRLP
jgi:aminocarboxymuconate-semialdehyde decarboxylase